MKHEKGGNGSVRLIPPNIGKLSATNDDALTDNFAAFPKGYLS